jgi:hypothetical protein
MQIRGQEGATPRFDSFRFGVRGLTRGYMPSPAPRVNVIACNASARSSRASLISPDCLRRRPRVTLGALQLI